MFPFDGIVRQFRKFFDQCSFQWFSGGVPLRNTLNPPRGNFDLSNCIPKPSVNLHAIFRRMFSAPPDTGNHENRVFEGGCLKTILIFENNPDVVGKGVEMHPVKIRSHWLYAGSNTTRAQIRLSIIRVKPRYVQRTLVSFREPCLNFCCWIPSNPTCETSSISYINVPAPYRLFTGGGDVVKCMSNSKLVSSSPVIIRVDSHFICASCSI